MSHYWILQAGSMPMILGLPLSTLPIVNFMTALTTSASSAPKLLSLSSAPATQQRSPCSLNPWIYLPNKRVIYLAINDNCNHTAGGTQWSLLVYLQNKNGFFHYDSYGSSNSFHAKQVAEKLEAFLGRKGNKLAIVGEKTPAQQSSCDFGMYMIRNTEALRQNFSKPQPKSIWQLLTPTHITKKREEWKDLTARLANN